MKNKSNININNLHYVHKLFHLKQLYEKVLFASMNSVEEDKYIELNRENIPGNKITNQIYILPMVWCEDTIR
jgi:hypothetical protein